MNKKIVYLGPAGSYTEIATDRIAGLGGYHDFEPVIENSILKVIESLDNNNGYIGVIPIENSIEGIVRETVDNLIKTTSRVMITKEVILPINHCLISKSTDLASIKKVTSHPQALAQCQRYLNNNFGGKIEVITSTSTSEAVKSLLELPDYYAAIGTLKAAEIYGLNILQTQINDEKDNLTRFICLDSQILAPTGNDKTSIAFSVCNKPGALVNLLQSFKENNINLSYIESRPSKKVFGDYTFFIDFDGHIEDTQVQKTIGKIAPLINFYRFLGSYPKGSVDIQ